MILETHFPKSCHILYPWKSACVFILTVSGWSHFYHNKNHQNCSFVCFRTWSFQACLWEPSPVLMLSAWRTTEPFLTYHLSQNWSRGWYCPSVSITFLPIACLIRISQQTKRITPPKLLCFMSQIACKRLLTEEIFLFCLCWICRLLLIP